VRFFIFCLGQDKEKAPPHGGDFLKFQKVRCCSRTFGTAKNADRHVSQGVAIDKQQVGEVALAYMAELVAHVHQLGADARRAGERFAGAISEQLDKMLDVPRIGALRCYVEAVVATEHHADAALVIF
jgi:hypothetical protein